MQLTFYVVKAVKTIMSMLQKNNLTCRSNEFTNRVKVLPNDKL